MPPRTHDARVSRITDHVIELAPDKLPPEAPPRQEQFAPGRMVFAQGERSDYVYVIDRGEIALHGPSEELRENPALIRLLAP